MNQAYQYSRQGHEARQGREAHSAIPHDLVVRSYNFPEDISFQDLVSRKNVLHELMHEFQTQQGDRVVFDPRKSEDYHKRLLLLENQIEGLMRTGMIYEGGQGKANIDYSNLLNEKENQINELERKIAHYDSSFRKHDYRLRELEDEITRLHSIIIEKNRVIEHMEGRNIREWVGNRDALAYADKLMANLENFRKNNSPSFGMLDGTVEAWILNLPDSSDLKHKLQAAETRMISQSKYRDFVMAKLSQVNRLYKSQINDLNSKVGSSTRVTYDENLLRATSLEENERNDPIFESVFAGHMGHSSGRLDFEKIISKTVEVPVQDARTKALIYKLAKQMNRLYKKYPSLAKQIDPKLVEFFSQEMLEVIEVDEVDRLIEIVKIQPQVVKVDNVYAYSSEKSRKVEFHLRVLIKALLEEMEKMRAKTGINPQIDEGVIGMIRNEIMDVVDVDDILKVYRPAPKIVEVEKVIEKVVEKIVEVPRFVTAETRSEAPVEVIKTQVLQNTVNVPVQHPVVTELIQERMVEVPNIINNVIAHPQIHERVAETIVERPKVVRVDNVVTLEKQVPRIVQIPGPERVVEIPRPEVIECVKQVIVETVKEVETIKEVEIVVEKIVEVVKEVPKIVEVEKIIEKVVPQREYVESERVVNNVIERYEPVQLIQEKIVPVVRVEERIVQVPQVIQKIVPVVEVQTEIVEVKIIEEKPIFQKELQIVEQIREVPVVEVREVERIVEKIVEVPIIHEKIMIEREFVKEPVIQTVEKIIHKEVELQRPVVMYEDRIVEVDKVLNHVVEVPQIIKIERETLVPYEKVINQVVAEPTIVEKIIEKIVQVPKVVQIEKVVEKIVPVPRVVEKVVQVEKIVQKIVKQLVIEERIVEKEYRVEVPVFQDRIIQIEKPVNYYQRVEVPKEVREEVMVRDTVTHTVPEIREFQQPPKIVVETREVDVPMVIQKIVTLQSTDNKYVELKQTEIIPVEIQLPVDIIKQKIVPVKHVVPEIQVEKAIMEKIVQVQTEQEPRVIEVESITEKLRVEKELQIVENKVPYYQDQIVEVQVMVDRIIEPVYYEVEKIVQVPTFIDKVVQRVISIPKVYEVEKRNDVIVKDPVIIPIEKMVPQLITLNKSIENIVDRIIEVPRLLQKLQVVDQVQERIVPQTNVETRVEEVRTIQEKEVIIEKIKEVENTIHSVNEVLKTVERVIERPTEPIIICEDRVMEVPFIVEKIVEKIVVMPQVVEVLKYVHELVDNEALVSSHETVVEDAEYTNLARNVNLEVTKLKGVLRDLKPDTPESRRQIATIENFLTEFNKFVAYPRIRQIINEKRVDNVIEKDRVVRVPVQNSEDSQRSLASAVLIDKLINELRRLKQSNPNMKWELDEDILQIFGGQLQPISKYYGNDYNKVLDEYVRAVHNRFSSVGPWTSDHQIMLKSFIQQRFDLAYNYKKAAADSAKTKARYESVLQSHSRMKDENERMRNSFEILSGIFPTVIREGRRQNTIDSVTQSKFNEAFQGLNQLVVTKTIMGGAHTQRLPPLQNERFHSMLREKEQEIVRLKDRIRELMMGKSGHTHHHSWQEVVSVGMLGSGGDVDCSKYKETIRVLEARIRELEARIRELESEIMRFRNFEDSHRNCFAEIETLRAENNRLKMSVESFKSPRESRGTKPSLTSPRGYGSEQQKNSSDGTNSLYGVNYLEYANLDEQGERDERIERGVYRSGNYGGNDRLGTSTYNVQQYSTHHVNSRHIISSSNVEEGNYNFSLGGSSASSTGGAGDQSLSRGGTTYHSGHRQGAEGISSYQTVEYRSGSIPSEAQMEGRYEDSSSYTSPNREIIRERLEQNTGSRHTYGNDKESYR